MAAIKGYKVFNPDWTCRGFQYKVGETFVHNGNIEMCGSGFHFRRKASDCFNYYAFDSSNKVAEVEAIGLVKTYNDKSVTDKIKIVREIEWQELLSTVNTGNCNTGFCNTGNYNTSNYNTGDCNTGYADTGNYNIGARNTGDYNTGDRNAGNYNTGDCNTGYCNTGIYNAGNYNTGDYNTGCWNSTDFSTGFFNSVEQPVYMFNKPTDKYISEVFDIKGIEILNRNFKNSWWVYSEDMSAKEKKRHPEHETTGGYLKTVDFKTACKTMWESLNDDEKEAVKAIPNFDADVFEEITGINVN